MVVSADGLNERYTVVLPLDPTRTIASILLQAISSTLIFVIQESVVRGDESPPITESISEPGTGVSLAVFYAQCSNLFSIVGPPADDARLSPYPPIQSVAAELHEAVQFFRVSDPEEDQPPRTFYPSSRTRCFFAPSAIKKKMQTLKPDRCCFCW